MIVHVRVSTDIFTCRVDLDDFTHEIVYAAPILRRFRGQNVHNLWAWLSSRRADYETVVIGFSHLP